MEERRPEMIWLSAALTAGAVFGGLLFLATMLRKASFPLQQAYSVAGVVALSTLVGLLAGGAVAAFGFSRGPLPSLPEPADRYADNEDLREAERRAREGEVD